MDQRRSLARALTLIRIASALVPHRLRDEWRREWEGELSAGASIPPSPSASARQALVRHALGSFIDAFWIRQRDVADLRAIDDLRHGLRQWTQQSGFVITTVGILAAMHFTVAHRNTATQPAELAFHLNTQADLLLDGSVPTITGGRMRAPTGPV